MNEVAGRGQQQTPTVFNDICMLPCVVWSVAYYLTRKDAASLALASPSAARALHGCLQHLPCCPRIVVVASGSKKLLDMSFEHNGQPYRLQNSTGNAATADELRAVAAQQAAKRKRTARITMQRRHNTMWLTGIAVGPSTDSSSSDKQAVYLCDYATRGVLKYTAGSLRPLGVFASDAALANPEGITWLGSTCYVVSSSNNTIVGLGCTGDIQQVVDLPEGLMAWGLTAWDPARQGCMSECAPHHSCYRTTAAAAAAATEQVPTASTSNGCKLEGVKAGAGVASATAGGSDGGGNGAQVPDTPGCSAALFVAIDVEYYSKRYTVPPATATGCVVCVVVSPSGAMLEQPQKCSKVDIKRPRHLWVTSMDRLLLRLAGPCHATPGSALQTVNLQDMLPLHVRNFYPFDIQAILPSQYRAAATNTRRTVSWAAAGGTIAASSLIAAAHAAVHGNRADKGAAMLVMTLHQGPHNCGAVAMLSCRNRRYNSNMTSWPAEGSPLQEQDDAADVELVSFITGHKCLKEPNMIALL